MLYRLNRAHYQSFLVGGGVRDLLLSITPKDFDVVTDAKPNDIKKVFRNCRLIGKRFRLAHVHFGREIIEVATFRSNDSKNVERCKKTGAIRRDNTFGTLEEDAWRRDITINALYYNIANFSIIDLTGGMKDLKDKCIRIIGDPKERYLEDPVRILRVIRLAAKLDFTIEKDTLAPIKSMASTIADVSNSRIFEEVLKLFHKGAALKTFELLREQGVFKILFPSADTAIEKDEKTLEFVKKALSNTDQRINSGKTVTPAFLFSVFLWAPLQDCFEELLKTSDERPTVVRQHAMSEVMKQQNKQTVISKHFVNAIRNIWQLQSRFPRSMNRRARNVLTHPRFRAAYDFLLLRAEVEPDLKPIAEWWTDFQFADHEEQEIMMKSGK